MEPARSPEPFENARSATVTLPGSLTAEELALVGEVRDLYQSRLKVDCQGIPIIGKLKAMHEDFTRE
ncbi:MAG: hypothetical protein AB1331_10180 [Bacillota bacterium]